MLSITAVSLTAATAAHLAGKVWYTMYISGIQFISIYCPIECTKW